MRLDRTVICPAHCRTRVVQSEIAARSGGMVVRRVVAPVLVSLASLAAPLIAAQAPPSGQAGPQIPPTSTALILGQVVDGSSNQPVAAAIVTLMGGAGAGPTGRQRVMTGPDGRFVFHNLPPGEFELSASLMGYSSNTNSNPLGG